MKRSYPLFIFLLYLLCPALGFAQEPHPAPNIDREAFEQLTQFNGNEANKEFDDITANLSKNNVDLKTLSQAIERLDDLADGANHCIEDTNKELTNLLAQIKEFFGSETKAGKNVDSNYLENQKNLISEQLAQCRLFKIRANEALDTYRKKQINLQKKITLTRGKTIIQQWDQLPIDVQDMTLPELKPIDMKEMEYFLITLIPLSIIILFINLQLTRLTHKRWRKKKRIFAANTLLIFFSLFFGSVYIFFPDPFIMPGDNLSYGNLTIELSLALFCLFLYHYVFLLRRWPALLQCYGVDTMFLKRIGMAVLLIYFLRRVGIDALTLTQGSNDIKQFFENMILLISISAMLYFTLAFYLRHKELFARFGHNLLLYQVIILVAVGLLVVDFIGYTTLAINTAYFIFTLLLISGLGILLLVGINKFYYLLNSAPSSRRFLKKLFGYSSNPPYFELLLLKFLTQTLIVILLFYIFAQLIEEVSYFIESFIDYLINGFKVSGVYIYPFQWITGLFAFCSLSLLSRYIATQMSRSEQFEDEEEEKQVAMASIILYLGFAFSIVIALIMAGFSFTSLTIIAGALSVGIGLGLQSIVNNFFSGLILLIEKPIKAGDRIKIDNVEGFVKKVRVRSTQIVTPSQEDIIIPNSDLITRQVTNYMYTDKSWRVKCEVGVAYGSDIDLVNDLLMEVALAHPEVKKSPLKKPIILFTSFGESALIFQMWCLIRDVNKKYIVASELNFAIYKIFKEHKISIAFPQRDVHIKFENQELPWKKK